MNVRNSQFQGAIERAGQIACRYEMEFFGCSQATLPPLMEVFGVVEPALLRAATPLSGGVARRGTACGSLTGCLLMIGLLTGRDDLEMVAQYQRGMQFADKLCKKFEEAYGTIVCKEIQKIKFGRSFNLQDDEERKTLHEIMKTNPDGCQALVRDATRWTAEIVAEILEKGPPLARVIIGSDPAHMA
ncbi:MAG: C_GCAxxG_C_C family protein [Desulfobacteraceae bacterium]|nr:C_GCAxxG_C_C family protein [Desulfobacteraceae bacterium]